MQCRQQYTAGRAKIKNNKMATRLKISCNRKHFFNTQEGGRPSDTVRSFFDIFVPTGEKNSRGPSKLIIPDIFFRGSKSNSNEPSVNGTSSSSSTRSDTYYIVSKSTYRYCLKSLNCHVSAFLYSTVQYSDLLPCYSAYSVHRSSNSLKF
jgi:hypothetical protein